MDQPQYNLAFLKGKSVLELSTCPDEVCFNNKQNLAFLRSHMGMLINPITSLRGANMTSFGNIAHLALYAPEPYRSYARLRFEELMCLLDKVYPSDQSTCV